MEIDAYDGSDLFKVWEEADGSGEVYVYNAAGTAKVRLDADGISYFTGGCLGIGTTAPSERTNCILQAEQAIPVILRPHVRNTTAGTAAESTVRASGYDAGGVYLRAHSSLFTTSSQRQYRTPSAPVQADSQPFRRLGDFRRKHASADMSFWTANGTQRIFDRRCKRNVGILDDRRR